MTPTEPKSSVKSKVLYIDDEAGNLSSFRAGFRKDFEIFTASGAAEGLNILAKEPDIKIVVADQRMPGMTGVELFEKLRDSHPSIIRILLTGYSDISAVIDAINLGHVYKFIDKPWDYDHIRIELQNACELFDTREDLRAKNKSLQKANEELDKFAYSVSHDLRAPLTSMQGICNLAALEVPDEKALEYFGMIGKLIDRLDNFILQMIDYYKTNHDDRINHPIDFNAVIGDLIQGYRLQPEAKNITFDVSVKQEEPFVSNAIKINVVLNNLISNAIKYMKPDEANQTVKIDIEVTDFEAHLVIEDNGIGISKDRLDDIFNMFVRATGMSTGSGLGLYIVKETVERLNGTIQASSEPGVGTKFEVRLPSVIE